MKKLLFICVFVLSGQVYAQSFEELTQAAIAASKKNNYAESIRLLNKALAIDTGNHLIYDRLALNYYQLNKPDSAILYCNLSLAKAPDDTTALYYRGYCYMDQEKYGQALEDFKKSFEGSGKHNADASFQIGKCYSYSGKFDDAIRYYQLTLKLQPNDPYSFYEMGYCYSSMSPVEKDKALEYYTKAIEQDSSYYDPYFNRGLLYATQFKIPAKAHQDLEKSIALRPKRKDGYFYNGILYREEKDFSKSKDMFNAVIQLYPDYADAYYERAITWYSIGILNMVCKDLDNAEKYGYARATEMKKKLCK